MQKLITLLGASLIAMSAHGQITLTNSGYTHLIGEDTTRSIDTSSFSVGSLAAAHTGYTWDLSGYTYDPGATYFTRYSPSSSFTGSTYSDGIFYPFGGLSYTDTAAYTVSSTGILRVGESMARQAYSLATLTGNTLDSLVFPKQTIAYSTGNNARLQFPATYNTNWSSSYASSTAFALTVTSGGITNTPGIRKALVQLKDTVVGWGYIKARNEAGNISGATPVLQVHETFTSRDSFFLGGAPAPTALLAAFGLTQGMVSTEYRVHFYQAGETMPVASANYVDPGMTKSRSNKVYVNNKRLAAPTGVSGLSANNDVLIYPNPVTNRQVNITLPSDNATWSYEMLNVTGQKVAAASLIQTGKTAKITVPEALNSGNYFIRLTSSDGTSVTRQIELR